MSSLLPLPMGYDILDILVVDDNPTDAELTLRALRKAGLGQHLRWAESGAEALDLLRAAGAPGAAPHSLPRLILLDLKMPGMDGLEVLQSIKSLTALQRIPVVMLTTSSEPADIDRAYALGANSFLVKPVELRQLEAQVVQAGAYWMLANRPPH